MSTFKNKTILITGGTSGIGFATAQAFLALDAKVIITGRSENSLEKALKSLTGNIFGFVLDLSKDEYIETLTSEIAKYTDRIDSLFINAGVGGFCPIAYTPTFQFETVMNVNFKGAFFTLQKCMPFLKEGASVVCTSSVGATNFMNYSSVYSASKAALNAFAKTAAIELAPQKIRVNILNPGPTTTSFLDNAGLNENESSSFIASMEEQIPLKRFGTASEVAQMVLFLFSDEANFITGSEFTIDGGVSINTLN